MNIRETKTYSMSFSKEEATLIDSLVREQVGKRTINSILDEYSYVINYYSALFTLVQKVYNVGSYNPFSSDEIRVLTDHPLDGQLHLVAVVAVELLLVEK